MITVTNDIGKYILLICPVMESVTIDDIIILNNVFIYNELKSIVNKKYNNPNKYIKHDTI